MSYSIHIRTVLLLPSLKRLHNKKSTSINVHMAKPPSVKNIRIPDKYFFAYNRCKPPTNNMLPTMARTKQNDFDFCDVVFVFMR